MIRKVVLCNFKKFAQVDIDLDGPVVFAGPNNSGKTTVLQAIAAWSFALDRWKELNDFQRHKGGYTYAPIARQAFAAVPLRNFDLLFHERASQTIEIEVQASAGWRLTMELHADSTEQIYVRPKNEAEPDTARRAGVTAVYVPPMTGLSVEEPVYQPAFVAHTLGQRRPGEVLRNLLVAAHQDTAAWDRLRDSVNRLFGVTLEPPQATGAFIRAEYRERAGAPAFDIASAGSGFQQVLMLLAFLHTREGAVLLIDEPDAHLHVILQDVIYRELVSLAASRGSQLMVATHSDVVIESVDPRELRIFTKGGARRLEAPDERTRLIRSLGLVSQMELVLAQEAPGILYVEGRTDLNLLITWAKVLQHPAHATLTTHLLWRAEPDPARQREHFQALELFAKLPGLALLDGDAGKPGPQPTPLSGDGFQVARWTRYEAESYLVHPDVVLRYAERALGRAAAVGVRDAVLGWFDRTFRTHEPAAFMGGDMIVETVLRGQKGRTEFLPPLLSAAGVLGLEYTHWDQIAAIMLPSEIHPEIIEKLDAIQKAFRLAP